ncbi:ornithine cyclodeaminase/mu-crystallin family protein [Pseudomonas putida]|nr:ornithine cyclodeaminase/mu-crystallin family protein [Pseudomonas putida]
MKVFSKAQITASFNPELAVSLLEEGFIAYSSGKVQVPPVQAFAFQAANGDCCVKSAYIEGSPTFTVKLSTGFYDNPSKGLPSNDGLMLVPLGAHRAAAGTAAGPRLADRHAHRAGRRIAARH